VSVRISRQRAIRIPRGTSLSRLRAAVGAALAVGGRPEIDVEVVLVGDETLARMHAQWLGDPSPTDVLSFDLGSDANGPAGEIYVSADRARAVALRRGLDAARELELYAVHGALHLCGFDDREPRARRRMRRAERNALDLAARPATPSRPRRSPRLPS
jgi:probable rRNA maturation factor